MSLNKLNAVSAAKAIRDCEITSEDLVRSCLNQIAATEARIQAWAYLDPEQALEQARAADRQQKSGKLLGPLHGIPVGIKDVYDTADMPTENGTVIHAGRRPLQDATAVALLRKAGAVIMGKTVTTELATSAPGKTTNPHDEQRTPGGSSSGSAAAVAAEMVPLAVGTQTNGSVVRPASYCGVVGFKPSYGLISRHGILMQSRTLDQPGVFARTVDDAALIAQQLVAYDANDPDMLVDAHLALGDDWQQDPRSQPRIAFIKSPIWDNMSETGKTAFAQLCGRWGNLVDELPLPEIFASAHRWMQIIMEADIASCYADIYAGGKDRLSVGLREMIARGQQYTAIDYSRARDGAVNLKRALDSLFANYDAILTPATSSEAPKGLAFTGSPMFCSIWTLCGAPAINLPILHGEDSMPMGAQLVARRGDDAGLLRLARWLAREQR